ncbi:Zinc finger C2H2-type [Cinara cedri]|uniref:Zinc finger C2H2-type n=1 Tax=Cinara cedri TaxID=506608 RepID=A0A5E4NLN6_9HEMI|nr:Zinc finger C2H2-type [Cinara cedri]
MDRRTESDPAAPVDSADTSSFCPGPIMHTSDYGAAGTPSAGEQVAPPLNRGDGWLVDLVNNFAGPSDQPRQLKFTIPITVPGVDDQCKTIQIEVVTQGDKPGEITGDPVLGQLACNQEQNNENVQIQLEQEDDVLNYQILNSSNNDALELFSSLQENNIIQDGSPVVPECHNHPKIIFMCSTCRKVFKNKSALNKHEIIHTGIKTQICHICGKGFYFPYELKRHIKKHNVENLKYRLETFQQIVKQSIHNYNDTIQQSLQEDQNLIQDCEPVIMEQSSTSSNSNQYVMTHTSNTNIYNSLSDTSMYYDTPHEYIFNSSFDNTESEHGDLISSTTQNNNIDTHKADTDDYDITNENGIPIQFILNYAPDEYTENTKYFEPSGTQEHDNTEIEITDNQENGQFTLSSLDEIQMIEHNSDNQTPHTFNTNISDPLKNSLKDFLNFLPDKTKSETLKSSHEDSNNIKTDNQVSTEPKKIQIESATDETMLLNCPECNKIYTQKAKLEQHLIDHKIKRNFICEICGAGCKRRSDLNRHKICHNPDLPFVCNICFKGFKRRYSLKVHVKNH